jgi:hypothetical protein
VQIENIPKMKKIFQKFDTTKGEKERDTGKETTFIGKTFVVGKCTVTVEEVLAEGMNRKKEICNVGRLHYLENSTPFPVSFSTKKTQANCSNPKDLRSHISVDYPN